MALADVDDSRNEDGEGCVACVTPAFATLRADEVDALRKCFGNVLGMADHAVSDDVSGHNAQALVMNALHNWDSGRV